MALFEVSLVLRFSLYCANLGNKSGFCKFRIRSQLNFSFYKVNYLVHSNNSTVNSETNNI